MLDTTTNKILKFTIINTKHAFWNSLWLKDKNKFIYLSKNYCVHSLCHETTMQHDHI